MSSYHEIPIEERKRSNTTEEFQRLKRVGRWKGALSKEAVYKTGTPPPILHPLLKGTDKASVGKKGK